MNYPDVTFLLLTYRQGRFVREAMRAALAQDYSPLTVVCVDDCSPDDTFAVLQDEAGSYAGPHRVVLHRNERNLGLGGSLNAAMQRVTTDLVIVAAGDDISLPERARRIVNEYREAGGCAFSICSAAILLDEDGVPLRILSPDTRTLTAEALARRYSTLLGATQAWHRDLFAVFGPYDARIWREDHIIPFRAALLGEIRAIQEPLVLYRSHSANMSWREGGGWRGSDWYFGELRRNAEENLLICHQRLADLAVAQSRGLLPAELLERLYAVANTRLREATAEVRITSRSSPFTRVAEVLHAVANGCRPRVGVRWILQYGAPRLWTWLHKSLQTLSAWRSGTEGIRLPVTGPSGSADRLSRGDGGQEDPPTPHSTT